MNFDVFWSSTWTSFILGNMQGGIRSIYSHGSVFKNAVLQHVRLVNPATRSLLFARHESAQAASIDEQGFESTIISDILKTKGKNADGSWLWCTTDDSVYDAVKSVCTIDNWFNRSSRLSLTKFICSLFVYLIHCFVNVSRI